VTAKLLRQWGVMFIIVGLCGGIGNMFACTLSGDVRHADPTFDQLFTMIGVICIGLIAVGFVLWNQEDEKP
jgi:hypothetical protein